MMKQVLFPLSVFLLGAIAVAPASLPTASSAASKPMTSVQLAQLGEDIEVLRRVLFLRLRASLGSEQDASSKQNQASLECQRSPVGHVDATYLPGYGLCLSVEMRPARAPGKGSQSDPQTELWSQIQADVRASRSLPESYLANQSPSCPACEAQASHYSVTAVADTIVRTLANHAQRVRGLNGSDRISVGIHLTGRSGDVLGHLAHSWQRSRSPRGGLPPRPEPVAKALLPRPKHETAQPLAAPPGLEELQADGLGPAHLLLTFQKKDLDRFQNGEIDLSKLAEHAEVVYY